MAWHGMAGVGAVLRGGRGSAGLRAHQVVHAAQVGVAAVVIVLQPRVHPLLFEQELHLVVLQRETRLRRLAHTTTAQG